jgi:hypothetical protein
LFETVGGIMERRIASRSIPGFLLLALAGLCSPNNPQAQPPAPWVTGEVRIVNALLSLEPSSQQVPLNVGTVVNPSFGAPGALPPAGWVAEAELAGPAFASPLSLTDVPGRPFLIPPLPLAGTYTLQNIRIMAGGAEVPMASPPSPATIEAVNLLVSSVTSRPMTFEEIQASGIVLNTSDYRAVRFAVGILLSDWRSQLKVYHNGLGAVHRVLSHL